MAEFVFHLFAQFGEGLAVAKGCEKRIVTEAPMPAGRQTDAAFADALEQLRTADAGRRSDFNECQRAAKTGGALFPRHAREQTQKLLIVGGIGRILAGSLRRVVL